MRSFLEAAGRVGLLLALACGLPIAARVLATLPSSRVVSCKSVTVHRTYAEVTFADGRTESLSPDDIRDPSRCLPVGTLVEKRRGELGYRIDGIPHLWTSNSWTVLPTLTFVGILLFVLWRVGKRSLHYSGL